MKAWEAFPLKDGNMQPVLRQQGSYRRAGRPPTDDEDII
jgi:hypothetical protein